MRRYHVELFTNTSTWLDFESFKTCFCKRQAGMTRKNHLPIKPAPQYSPGPVRPVSCERGSETMTLEVGELEDPLVVVNVGHQSGQLKTTQLDSKVNNNNHRQSTDTKPMRVTLEPLRSETRSRMNNVHLSIADKRTSLDPRLQKRSQIAVARLVSQLSTATPSSATSIRSLGSQGDVRNPTQSDNVLSNQQVGPTATGSTHNVATYISSWPQSGSTQEFTHPSVPMIPKPTRRPSRFFASRTPQGTPQGRYPPTPMPFNQRSWPRHPHFMPQRGMPQRGMPQRGMPQRGMPQRGMPQRGMPPHAYPQFHSQFYYHNIQSQGPVRPNTWCTPCQTSWKPFGGHGVNGTHSMQGRKEHPKPNNQPQNISSKMDISNGKNHSHARSQYRKATPWKSKDGHKQLKQDITVKEEPALSQRSFQERSSTPSKNSSELRVVKSLKESDKPHSENRIVQPELKRQKSAEAPTPTWSPFTPQTSSPEVVPPPKYLSPIWKAAKTHDSVVNKSKLPQKRRKSSSQPDDSKTGSHNFISNEPVKKVIKMLDIPLEKSKSPHERSRSSSLPEGSKTRSHSSNSNEPVEKAAVMHNCDMDHSKYPQEKRKLSSHLEDSQIGTNSSQTGTNSSITNEPTEKVARSNDCTSKKSNALHKRSNSSGYPEGSKTGGHIVVSNETAEKTIIVRDCALDKSKSQRKKNRASSLPNGSKAGCHSSNYKEPIEKAAVTLDCASDKSKFPQKRGKSSSHPKGSKTGSNSSIGNEPIEKVTSMNDCTSNKSKALHKRSKSSSPPEGSKKICLSSASNEPIEKDAITLTQSKVPHTKNNSSSNSDDLKAGHRNSFSDEHTKPEKLKHRWMRAAEAQKADDAMSTPQLRPQKKKKVRPPKKNSSLKGTTSGEKSTKKSSCKGSVSKLRANKLPTLEPVVTMLRREIIRSASKSNITDKPTKLLDTENRNCDAPDRNEEVNMTSVLSPVKEKTQDFSGRVVPNLVLEGFHISPDTFDALGHNVVIKSEKDELSVEDSSGIGTSQEEFSGEEIMDGGLQVVGNIVPDLIKPEKDSPSEESFAEQQLLQADVSLEPINQSEVVPAEETSGETSDETSDEIVEGLIIIGKELFEPSVVIAPTALNVTEGEADEVFEEDMVKGDTYDASQLPNLLIKGEKLDTETGDTRETGDMRETGDTRETPSQLIQNITNEKVNNDDSKEVLKVVSDVVKDVSDFNSKLVSRITALREEHSTKEQVNRLLGRIIRSVADTDNMLQQVMCEVKNSSQEASTPERVLGTLYAVRKTSSDQELSPVVTESFDKSVVDAFVDISSLSQDDGSMTNMSASVNKSLGTPETLCPHVGINDSVRVIDNCLEDLSHLSTEFSSDAPPSMEEDSELERDRPVKKTKKRHISLQQKATSELRAVVRRSVFISPSHDKRGFRHRTPLRTFEQGLSTPIECAPKTSTPKTPKDAENEKRVPQTQMNITYDLSKVGTQEDADVRETAPDEKAFSEMMPEVNHVGHITAEEIVDGPNTDNTESTLEEIAADCNKDGQEIVTQTCLPSEGGHQETVTQTCLPSKGGHQETVTQTHPSKGVHQETVTHTCHSSKGGHQETVTQTHPSKGVHQEAATQTCHPSKGGHQETVTHTCHSSKDGRQETVTQTCLPSKGGHQETVTQTCRTSKGVHQEAVTQTCHPSKGGHQETVTHTCHSSKGGRQETVTQTCLPSKGGHQETVTQTCRTRKGGHQETVTQTHPSKGVHQEAVTQTCHPSKGVHQETVNQTCLPSKGGHQETVTQTRRTRKGVHQETVTQTHPSKGVHQETVTQTCQPSEGGQETVTQTCHSGKGAQETVTQTCHPDKDGLETITHICHQSKVGQKTVTHNFHLSKDGQEMITQICHPAWNLNCFVDLGKRADALAEFRIPRVKIEELSADEDAGSSVTDKNADSDQDTDVYQDTDSEHSTKRCNDDESRCSSSGSEGDSSVISASTGSNKNSSATPNGRPKKRKRRQVTPVPAEGEFWGTRWPSERFQPLLVAKSPDNIYRIRRARSANRKRRRKARFLGLSSVTRVKRIRSRGIRDRNKCFHILDTVYNFKESDILCMEITSEDIPDYHSVVKYPMCLDFIARKLRRQVYNCLEEFVSDFRRVFYNCRLYYKDPKCQERISCALTEEVFEEILKSTYPEENFTAITGSPPYGKRRRRTSPEIDLGRLKLE